MYLFHKEGTCRDYKSNLRYQSLTRERKHNRQIKFDKANKIEENFLEKSSDCNIRTGKLFRRRRYFAKIRS